MRQQPLWRTHGGRRPGAGRKRTPRSPIPHRSRAPFRRGTCHVTSRRIRGLRSLRNRRIVRRIERTFRRGCERPDFRLVHYSIQRDHLHFVVEAVDADALGRGVRSLLIRVARAANRIWGRKGQVIEDRYHVRRLRTPTEVCNVIRYGLLNARKHVGHGVQEVDQASSGRWWDGWGRRRPRARDAPAVARPSWWLLRVGWRRGPPLDV